MTLLIRDGGAAWAGEVEDFVAFESCFFAPAPEINTAKVDPGQDMATGLRGRRDQK